VRGLSEFPPGERPNVLVTHLAFQLMVGSGFALLALAAWFWIARARSRGRGEPRALLVAIALASPLGFLALEAGWVVTEVGRQPWVVYRVMRTAEAVTARDDLAPTALAFAFVYVVLAVALVGILRAMAQKRRMRVAAERRS
jgi:cytochrome d ubiquinol oxidase subunit I